ncbi:MAG: ATP-binding protein [Candidatus Theseobacter exili]|nr:ATP-binding protein [Candidatus Theseobacter exili]
MTRNQFKFGIASKFIILFTILITLTSTILSLSFINSKTSDSVSFLKEKGILLARNLAYTSEYGVLTSSREPLEKLLNGIMNEPDIAYAIIHNAYGKILAKSMKENNYKIPALITQNALECKKDTYVIQEFSVPGYSTSFYEIAFPIITRRLKRTNEWNELFPGYMGILEQLRKYIDFEGEIFEEQIGIARVGLSKKHLIASTRRIKKTIGIITMTVVAIGITLTILLVRIIVDPIHRLVRGTRQLSEGNLSFKVKVSSSDEIGELAQSFNQMTQSLRTYNNQIEEYSHTLEEKVLERTKQLKETELELIRYEKFDAIVEFITGMTHELNNKLTPILGYIQILRTLNMGKEIDQYITVMEDSAMNAKHIVESLLKYSRPVPPKKEHLNLNETMKKTLHLIEPRIRMQGISLKVSFSDKIPKTMVDDSQISQAFLNILNNACQAMEEKPQGPHTLSISSSQTQKNKIRISISDTGEGIPEENLTKIFDPFFTTKEVGKGTGLGLSVTFGIIQGHEGSINVSSTLDQGTTFIIELPIKDAQVNIKPSAQPTDVPDKLKRKAEILVVDDDKSVRAVIRDGLKTHHNITLTSNADAAKNWIKKKTFDLIFIDLRMPKITGQELFKWISEQFSSEIEKTVFITGDTSDEKTKIFLDETARPRLIKPFSIDILLNTIAAVVKK